MFDENYSGEKYPVNSIVLNEPNKTNHIDGFNLSIKDTTSFQINMLQGVLFADGTKIANTGNKTIDLIKPEVVSETTLEFSLNAAVLNDADAVVNISGVKFKSDALSDLTNAVVTVDGHTIQADADGWYTYQDSIASGSKRRLHG